MSFTIKKQTGEITQFTLRKNNEMWIIKKKSDFDYTIHPSKIIINPNNNEESIIIYPELNPGICDDDWEKLNDFNYFLGGDEDEDVNSKIENIIN
jgi:hypothetical protein